MGNIEKYLTLERARFGDRLQVRWRVAPEVLGVVVPFLAIQPLVENAVRHGLAGRAEGGTVSVTAQDAGPDCLISVEDDGIGMDPESVGRLEDIDPSGTHVGLNNVDDRLRAAFGQDYGLIVETAPGAGTKVIVRLPKFAPGVSAGRREYRPVVGSVVTDPRGCRSVQGAHRIRVSLVRWIAGIVGVTWSARVTTLRAERPVTAGIVTLRLQPSMCLRSLYPQPNPGQRIPSRVARRGITQRRLGLKVPMWHRLMQSLRTPAVRGGRRRLDCGDGGLVGGACDCVPRRDRTRHQFVDPIPLRQQTVSVMRGDHVQGRRP